MSTIDTVPPLHDFLPKQLAQTFTPIGRCIYCGSDDEPSDEHIIPLGLGGRLVLPDSSCPTCSAATSKLERTCMRTMYGPLRLLYGLPSRRKSKRPKTLLLKVKKSESSDWVYMPVDQERYPFLITFPYFDAPGSLSGLDQSDSAGPVTRRLWIRGASPHHNFQELLESLTRELNVYSLMPESKADVSAFCSLLAKIALSYIAAQEGGSTQRSRLSQIALGERMENCMHFIGSVATDEQPSKELHEISLVKDARTGSTLVRIRLLAKLGTPTYFVVFQNAGDG